MAAKRILTSRAKSGMVTADDVYTSDNQLVIPKGTVLTEEILKALKDYSIFAIRVEVEEADGQQKEVFVPEEEEIPDIKEKQTVYDPIGLNKAGRDFTIVLAGS